METSASNRRLPRFNRAETPPRFQLTERDIEVIRQVARHRLLRSTHISQLLQASHKKICERLTPLYHAGYLDRPRAQLEYFVRGGGSSPLVYALGNRGAQLLASHDNFGNIKIDWRDKNKQLGREFIKHTLAISDVRVALSAACRNEAGPRFQDRDELFKTLPAATRSTRAPWAWRVRLQHDGAFQDIGLVPDHTFALLLSDGRRRPYVLECDRGTMPVKRSSLHQTSMLRKFLAYESASSQGIHTRQFGWRNFRVLTTTSSAERADNMRALIARTPPLKHSPVFLFAAHDQLAADNILAHCWIDAAGRAHSLV